MLTKNKLTFFLPLILAFLLVCCMKEKGTYIHKEINEVEIDTAGLNRITVQLGEQLNLSPQFKQTLEQSEDNLESSGKTQGSLAYSETEEDEDEGLGDGNLGRSTRGSVIGK